MNIKHKVYVVELGEERTYEVRVITADILRAEEVGPTYGVTHRAPIALNTLWIWAASVRTGQTDLSWPDFRAAVTDWQQIGEGVPVDPTQPAAPTTSPSVSPSGSEDSTTTDGSEPSSTTSG